MILMLLIVLFAISSYFFIKEIAENKKENDISFNEFFENHKLKILSKNKEYNDLKSKKRKTYDKYPEIMHLIEDSVPMTFDVEKVQAFDELQTICSMMDKIEVKEAYKLGAKESYIYMQYMDMLKI